MRKQVAIADARNQFAALVRHVEQNAVVELTRRGKPVAVLMSMEEYQWLQTPKIGFWDAFTRFRDQVDLQQADIHLEWFTEGRDQSPGREMA